MKRQPSEAFYTKDALKKIAKFIRKQLFRSLFFNKVAGLKPVTLLKRDSDTGVFSVNVY